MTSQRLTACFFFILILSQAGGAPAIAASRGRADDPVVVEGTAAASLAGRPVDTLCLMAWTGQGFTPIPFQIDRRNERKEYIFPGEKKARGPLSPVLGMTDEIVFMDFDAGPRAPAGTSPGHAAGGVEIDITDPVNGETSWVYLFAFPGRAPRSVTRYIRYSADSAARALRVESRNYILEFKDNAIYFHHLSLAQPDGTWSPNLIDRLKMRGAFTVLFGAITIPITADEDIHTQITASIQGPIRLVLRGEGYIDAWRKITLKGDSLLKFYPAFFIMPVNIFVPFDLRRLLTTFELRGYTDFTRNIYGAHCSDALNPWNADVVFDGTMSGAETRLHTAGDRDWIGGVGPYGAIINRIIFPPEWSFVTKQLFYADDPARADGPEAEPGLAAAGYDFTGLINLKKGAATYWLHFYFPLGYRAGEEARILNILDRPLTTAARPTVPSGF